MELLEIWAIVSLVIIIALIWYFRGCIRDLRQKLEKKQTGAYQIGSSQVKGDLCQLLGTLGILGEYNDLIILSTTSKQSSLDLIGIKEDALDFIEFKKKGAILQRSERKVQKLVENKQVNYRIIDVELPESVKISERGT